MTVQEAATALTAEQVNSLMWTVRLGAFVDSVDPEVKDLLMNDANWKATITRAQGANALQILFSSSISWLIIGVLIGQSLPREEQV